MIFDKQLMMSEGQNPTAADTHPSTNVIDLDKLGKDSGVSNIEVYCRVKTAVTSAGTATVTFKLETSSAEGFDGGTEVTLFDTGAIADETLVKDYRPFKIKLPRGTKRYLRMVYTIDTELTTGAFDAGLILDDQTNNA